MRSTSSSMMCWIAVVPTEASSTRTPSTTIRVWALRPPRMNRPVTAPTPPFCVYSNPASLCSSEGRSTACESLMSFRVRIVVCGIASRTGCSVREAVMTTASSAGADCAKASAGSAAIASAALVVMTRYMVSPFTRTASPQAGMRCYGRMGRSQLPSRAPTIASRNRPTAASCEADRSAGIRAGALCRIAFPRSEALHSGVLMRRNALTVAGAAQVASARRTLVPVSRLTRLAGERSGHRLRRKHYRVAVFLGCSVRGA